LLFRSLSNLSKMALTIISTRYKYDGHDFIMSYNCCTNTNILMYLFRLTANHFSCVTLPPEGLQFTAVFVLVFLSERMHNTKTTCPNFTKFSVHVICGHGLVLLWLRWCTVHDVTFSHNRANTDSGHSLANYSPGLARWCCWIAYLEAICNSRFPSFRLL